MSARRILKAKRRHIVINGLFLLCMLCSACVFADDNCRIVADKHQLDFGTFRYNDMEPGATFERGINWDWWAANPRDFRLFVTCLSPRKIRLFVDAPLQIGHRFRFSSAGAMSLTFKNASLDNRAAHMKLVSSGQEQPQGEEGTEMKLVAGKEISFTNGQELTGHKLEVTLQVRPYLSGQALGARDLNEIEESLRVGIETLL